MKHLSIKFLLLIGLISNLPLHIQAGRKPAGKRSPAQQQQYLAQQNRLRQAQQAQQEAAKKEKEAQEAAALAAQQETEQEKEKQETSAAAPAAAEPTTQPQQPATQVATQSEAQPQDQINQAEAMRYAQARAMQKKQVPMSLWRLAYLQLAPTAIQLLFKAIQEGTGTTMGSLIAGWAKRRQESLALPGKEAERLLKLELIKEHPEFAIMVPLKEQIKLGSPVELGSASKMINQAFYQGMLSAAGSVVSAVFISLIASGLQKLMPMPIQTEQEE